jgi:hypothetical protein
MMKAAILALLYLSAPALVAKDEMTKAQSPSQRASVIYKSSDVNETLGSVDSTNVADEENCDDVIFDVDAERDTALHRYTMLRTE